VDDDRAQAPRARRGHEARPLGGGHHDPDLLLRVDALLVEAPREPLVARPRTEAQDQRARSRAQPRLRRLEVLLRQSGDRPSREQGVRVQRVLAQVTVVTRLGHVLLERARGVVAGAEHRPIVLRRVARRTALARRADHDRDVAGHRVLQPVGQPRHAVEVHGGQVEVVARRDRDQRVGRGPGTRHVGLVRGARERRQGFAVATPRQHGA
jgi:hypothetical protein